MAKGKQREAPPLEDPEAPAEQAGAVTTEVPKTPSQTSLLASSVVARGVTYFARRAAEKAFLSSRYSQKIAKEAVEDRTMVNAIATYGITRIATRSVPGAVLVGGGLIAKALYDRSEKRRARQANRAARQETKAISETKQR